MIRLAPTPGRAFATAHRHRRTTPSASSTAALPGLLRYEGGSEGNLGSPELRPSAGRKTYVLRSEVQGTALRGYVNGALVYSTTDPGLPTGDQVGIHLYMHGDTASGAVDLFTADVLTSGTTRVTASRSTTWNTRDLTPVEVVADRKTALGVSTVAAPSNLVIGNTVALCVIGYDSATEVPACTGFTLRDIGRLTTGHMLYVGWLDRVVDGTEPWFAGGTLTVTGVIVNSGYAELFAFRITGAAPGLQTSAQASATGTTVAIPAFHYTIRTTWRS